MSKGEIRVTGAVRMLAGMGGLVGAGCFAALGWWIALPLVMFASYRTVTGLGLLVTGRPIVDVD